MAEITEINYVKLFVFFVLKMAIGMLWYSPVMFQNSFLKLLKIKREDVHRNKNDEDIFIGLLVQFIMSSLQIYVHYNLCILLKISNCLESLLLSLMIFTGFIASNNYSELLWNNKPIALFILNNGLPFFTLILFSFFLFI